MTIGARHNLMFSKIVDALCNYEKVKEMRRVTFTEEKELLDADSSHGLCYLSVKARWWSYPVSVVFSAFSHPIVGLCIFQNYETKKENAIQCGSMCVALSNAQWRTSVLLPQLEDHYSSSTTVISHSVVSSASYMKIPLSYISHSPESTIHWTF